MTFPEDPRNIALAFGRITGMMPTLPKITAFALSFLYLLAGAGTSIGQSFDQITRPTAILSRTSQIDSLFTELLIPPYDSVTYVEIVDLTGNGYGPDDIVIIHPVLAMYPLGASIPPSIRSIMASWELEADYRLDATLDESELVETDAQFRRDAAGAISGACVSAISQHYSGTDLDLRLERDAGGVRLEMWNFDPAALTYTPPPQTLQGLACEGPSDRSVVQQFRFAKPIIVTTFNEPGGCVETRIVEGKMETRSC